ncbi:MAG: hypothetical protein ACE5H4_09055 [Candidatus Thorarchaeota archaeon]
MTQPENRDDEPSPSEGSLHEAKRLLALTDIVDRYPQVMARRVAGITYILISGGISLGMVVLLGFTSVFASGPWNPLYGLVFVGASLGITWLIAFRLIGPLTRSYRQPESEMEGWFVAMWVVIAIAIIASSLVTFTQDWILVFPVTIQASVTVGSLGNYRAARGDADVSGTFAREHLSWAAATLLSILPIVAFPELAYTIVAVVDLGGVYLLGIYALITAERLLLESAGRV